VIAKLRLGIELTSLIIIALCRILWRSTGLFWGLFADFTRWCFVIVLICLDVYRISKAVNTKSTSVIATNIVYVSVLAMLTASCFIFTTQLDYLPEIINFNLHRSDFEDIVAAAYANSECAVSEEMYCDSDVHVGPYDWFEYGFIVRVQRNAGRFSILFLSRAYVTYVYMPDQDHPPSFTDAYFGNGIICSYQLGDDWYIC
jgi:hypothetical protein